MQVYKLYESIYRYFGDTTPIFGDCGKLCDKACCASDDTDETGMYLFPGEKVLFKNNPDYKIISSEFTYGEKTADIVICKSACDRNTRPLSCRIFPLVPYYRENVGLKIIRDPRAYAVCPLSSRAAEAYLNPLFIKKTQKTFALLTQFSEVRSFLTGLSDILDDYLKFEPGEVTCL